MGLTNGVRNSAVVLIWGGLNSGLIYISRDSYKTPMGLRVIFFYYLPTRVNVKKYRLRVKKKKKVLKNITCAELDARTVLFGIRSGY